MTKQQQLRQLVKGAPQGLGKRLGQVMLRKQKTVIEIASETGATRQTVYNWLAGRPVSNAYRRVVDELITRLS